MRTMAGPVTIAPRHTASVPVVMAPREHHQPKAVLATGTIGVAESREARRAQTPRCVATATRAVCVAPLEALATVSQQVSASASAFRHESGLVSRQHEGMVGGSS